MACIFNLDLCASFQTPRLPNSLAATNLQNSLLTYVRQFQTGSVRYDIDQAAKYIGAGAATVGVAGSGNSDVFIFKSRYSVDSLVAL